jgi:hypothetical protein
VSCGNCHLLHTDFISRLKLLCNAGLAANPYPMLAL